MTLALFYQGAGAAPAALSVEELTPDFEFRATWRPEQFDRCDTLGGFETDTSGWSVGAGINAAGTSIARITTDAYEGAACGRLVVSAPTADGGCNFDLGAETYFGDAAHSTLYLARLALKRNSTTSTRHVRVVLGSLGTTADRATLEIRDIANEWREYVVRWRPSAERTDAELAIMSGDGQVVDLLLDAVRVYSPLASQVENGHFESDLTGWDDAGGSIAAAASSWTHSTSGAFGGTGCATLVTTAADGSGVSYPLGTRRHIEGRTYRVRAGLRRQAGDTEARLRFGSIGTPADRGDETVTLTTDWAWYTCDWTPTADRSDACVAITNASAAALTVRIDEVEAYEALDELAVHELTTTRGSMTGGTDDPIGTLSGVVSDLTGLYDPHNTASELYGSALPGVPVYSRATYDGRLYGLTCGRLGSLAPDPYQESMSFSGSDGLDDLHNVEVSREFGFELSYAEARAEALLAAGLGARQLDLSTAGIEGGHFFDGTDGPVSALAYLSALNAATATTHVAEPSAHANVGWTYRSIDRATMTDDQGDLTIADDSRGPLPGIESRDDTLVTSARVGWQGYEQHYIPGSFDQIDYPWGAVAGSGRILAIGADPSLYPGETPYMRFTSEAYGSNSDIPDANPRVIWTIETHGWRRPRKVSGRTTQTRRTRILSGRYWEGGIFPMTVPLGTSREVVVEFAVPVAGVSVSADSTGVALSWVAEPSRVIITLAAADVAGTVSGLAVSGWAFIPQPAGEVTERSAAAVVGREVLSVDPTYIAGPAGASGVARYWIWRYGRPRLRPVVTDGLKPRRQMTTRVGDHVSLTVDRYRLDGLGCVVRGIRHRIARPLPWHTDLALEELPGEGDWVTIDGSTADGIDSSSATLAY